VPPVHRNWTVEADSVEPGAGVVISAGAGVALADDAVYV